MALDILEVASRGVKAPAEYEARGGENPAGLVRSRLGAERCTHVVAHGAVVRDVASGRVRSSRS